MSHYTSNTLFLSLLLRTCIDTMSWDELLHTGYNMFIHHNFSLYQYNDVYTRSSEILSNGGGSC